ncbi:MAG TPA: nitronate monooxygenase [Polyangiaceae bacterium]|jgi:nitronate monooxygenase
MSIESLRKALGTRLPIVQAPMANSTPPELVAAACEAGALGSIGAPYFAAADITAAAEAVRARTARPFAINLFLPGSPAPADPAATERARTILDRARRELGLPLDPPPAPARDGFDAQFEAALRARPAVFSFTMGVLDRDRVGALHAAGTVLVGTATTPEEGEALEAAGVDVVCAQGAEAGGHRGSFLVPTDDGLWGVLALVQQLAGRVRVPVLAAGGIMDGRGVAAALLAGASGVQMGTAFLACRESGAPTAHKAALCSPAARRTVLTRAFSGRHARAIANAYTDAFGALAVPPFPAFQGMTRDVRIGAARAGRIEWMQMFAGQNAAMSRDLPAAELVKAVVAEANEALGAASALRLVP